MYPKQHIILGAIFSVLIYFLFNLTFFEAATIFLSSFLIDFDHYMWYVVRNKTLDIRRSYMFYVNLKKNCKPIAHLFHTIEFHLLILFIGFYYPLFFFVLIGMVFHSILDIIYLIHEKCLGCREFSLIRYLVRDKINYM
jgi:hypothetical protein